MPAVKKQPLSTIFNYSHNKTLARVISREFPKHQLLSKSAVSELNRATQWLDSSLIKKTIKHKCTGLNYLWCIWYIWYFQLGLPTSTTPFWFKQWVPWRSGTRTGGLCTMHLALCIWTMRTIVGHRWTTRTPPLSKSLRRQNACAHSSSLMHVWWSKVACI